MKNKKSFIEKQTQEISYKVFEEDLVNFRKNNLIVSENFDKEVVVNGQTKRQYVVKTKVYSGISYEKLVVGAIREKYDENEELAILRKSLTNPNNEEFVEYNAFVEDCKSKAKDFIRERDNGIELEIVK